MINVADVLRLFVITGLGVLAVVTFLVAGTITGLMIVDEQNCRACDVYPIGLWTLGLLGALFAYSMVQVAIEQIPLKTSMWYPDNKEAFVLAGIVGAALVIIFAR
jgi:hypothetical protein